ncbi:MAG: hypothetical protein ACRC8F_03315 [Cetobacterium sp.]|uniref:hypothetical protein n=2 Tax=Cetobacterium sp. TaxID=2071632 RepID=UPI003EE672BC
MKKLLIPISLLLSAITFSAEIRNEQGSMNFPELKIEKVESATYVALASNSGEAYVFGLANDVLLDVQKGIKQQEVIGFYDSLDENKLETELYNVSFSDNKLNVKPTYEDFTIEFTQDETNKIFKTVKEEK